MRNEDVCPRCGLKTVETETKHKHPVEKNMRVNEVGDYIHDICGFCGWFSRWTWSKGGWQREESAPATAKTAIFLRVKVAEHLKLEKKTTTRKRARGAGVVKL